MPLITAEEVEQMVQERISVGEEWSMFLPEVWDMITERVVERLNIAPEHRTLLAPIIEAIARCRATFVPASWESPDLVIPFEQSELATFHNILALLHNSIGAGVRALEQLPWGQSPATAQQKRAAAELDGFVTALRTMTDTFRKHLKEGGTKRVALVASSFGVITQQCQNACALFLGPSGAEFTASQKLIGDTLRQVKELLDADTGEKKQ